MKRFIDKRPYVYTENYSSSKNVTIVFRIKNSQKRSFSIKTLISRKVHTASIFRCPISTKHILLVKVDISVQNVHFLRNWLFLLEMKNDACLGYTGSKNGWDTIKRFLLYWKIIRVDFPDACFCIISINCDSFVKTSNFINLRCTGNNHVATLYKNFFDN